MNQTMDIIRVGARSAQFFWALLQADLQFSITRLSATQQKCKSALSCSCVLASVTSDTTCAIFNLLVRTTFRMVSYDRSSLYSE